MNSARVPQPHILRRLLPADNNEPWYSTIRARNISMDLIASSLASGNSDVDRPIVDKTGLTGNYDFAIEFAPHVLPSDGSNFRPDPSAPVFTQAIREQLGLKLEPETTPMDVLVIDYIEQPLPH
jgi:uncharacterized protein (TIGR03435 family)